MINTAFPLKSRIFMYKSNTMKNYFFLIVSFLFLCSQLNSQTLQKDTAQAEEYNKTAKELYTTAQYDSAAYLYSLASDLYLKHELWDNYVYAESNEANCINLQYDFDGALLIINDALEKTKGKIDQESKAYAFALYQIGRVFSNKNIPDSALKYHLKALEIREKIYSEPTKELADSYYFLNKTYFSFYDLEKAMEYNTKAYDIAIDLFPADDFFCLSIMYDRGLIEFYSLNHRNAEKIFTDSYKLAVKRYGKDNFDNIFPVSYLGLVYQDLGDYDKSIEMQNEALRLAINSFGGEHYYVGASYQSLASLFNYKMEHEIAVEYSKKAISIYKNTFGENSKDVADVIGNLGIIYGDMGDFENSHAYLNKALEIYKEIEGDSTYDVGRMYQSIAAIYNDQGEYEKSKEISKLVLAMKEATVGENHYSVGMVCTNLGINETYLGNFDEAVKYLKRAEKIFLDYYGFKGANIATQYNNIADTYRFKEDIHKALHYFHIALVANNSQFNDSTNLFSLPPSEGYYSWHDYYLSFIGKAQILNFYADKFKNATKKEALLYSLEHYQVCDTIIDRVKRSAGNKSDKMNMAKISTDLYKGIVNTCIDLANVSGSKSEKSKYLELAFMYSEKNKASVLLEALAGAEAQKFAGIPDSLLTKEKNLQIDISYYKKLLAETTDEAEETDYLNKLFALNRDYDALIKQFEINYPKYHELKYAGYKVKVSELQNSLGKHDAILSYSLSDSSTIIFALTPKKFNVFELKEKDAIIKTVLSMRDNISNTYLLQEAFTENDNSIAIQYQNDAELLYSYLFPEEINKDFKKTKNLIIIPDGHLSTLPFEALLTQTYTGEWKGWSDTEYFAGMPYLIKEKNVSYAYSASLYYETIPKQKDQPEFQQLSDWLALAPVFDNDSISGTNLRTRQLIEKNAVNVDGELNTRAWLRDGSYVSPLPGSEEETKNIFHIFEDNNKKAVLKTHKFANEEYIKSGVLKDFRFLHVATHGMVNEDKPELSCILLAQDTTSTEDNILFSGEIYNLELNADLTVLSACETGLGKIAEGEGVIGLTRALLYAGSKNIIVSLWQVSDESTNQLMVDFYKNIFEDEEKTFSEHLSKSKLKLINDGKYAHPFFWSPFVLIGK
jgi:CHAT domain-containing protein